MVPGSRSASWIVFPLNTGVKSSSPSKWNRFFTSVVHFYISWQDTMPSLAKKANKWRLCKQYTAVFCALNQIWSVGSKNILQDLAGKNDQESVSHESVPLRVQPNTAHRELQSFILGQWVLWIILFFFVSLCSPMNSKPSFTCIVVIYSSFRHFLIR